VPKNGGVPGEYSGAAVWQPPAIDKKRGSLYVGTGDNYTAPLDVEACQNEIPNEDCTALGVVRKLHFSDASGRRLAGEVTQYPFSPAPAWFGPYKSDDG
jgi:hypothetical protein